MGLTQSEALRIWRASRALTTKVAAAMPASQADFAPWAGAMTFSGLIRHILSAEKTLVQAIKSRSGEFLWEQGLAAPPPDDLDEVRQLLTTLTVEHDAFFASLSDAAYAADMSAPWATRPVWTFLEEWIRHECHHRGQMYVYLRLCGVTPPNYDEG